MYVCYDKFIKGYKSLDTQTHLLEFYNLLRVFCNGVSKQSVLTNVHLDQVDARLNTIYLDFLTLKEMYGNISPDMGQFFVAIDELLFYTKSFVLRQYGSDTIDFPSLLIKDILRVYSKEFNSLKLGVKI